MIFQHAKARDVLLVGHPIWSETTEICFFEFSRFIIVFTKLFPVGLINQLVLRIIACLVLPRIFSTADSPIDLVYPY